MGSLASIFSLLACIVLVSSCGGGGGNNSSGGVSTSSAAINSSSAVSNNSIDSSSSSKSSSSQPVVIEDPLWKDAGSLGNDVLILSGDETNNRQYIQKLKPDGTITTLTPKLIDGGKIILISTSPDGKKIAYLADQDTDDVNELFIVNTNGSFSRKISHELINTDITSITWSLDSNYLLYGEYGNSVSKYYLKKYNEQSTSEIKYGITGSGYTILSVKFNDESTAYSYLASNKVDSHLVTVNLSTGIIKTDLLIDKSFQQGNRMSPSGKYIDYYSKIYDIETHETQSFDSGNPATWWLPSEDKLIAWNSSHDVSIYDPVQRVYKTIIDLNNKNLYYISWQNWKPLQEYVFFSLGEFDFLDETYIFSFNSGVTLRLKEILGTTEKIVDYQVSDNRRLLALTETNDLYTLNLDGTDIRYFDYLKTFGKISSISWTSDPSQLTFTYSQHENGVAFYSIKKLNLSTGNITTIPLEKTPNCLITISSSPANCGYYFQDK